jgi:hypothetical protein
MMGILTYGRELDSVATKCPKQGDVRLTWAVNRVPDKQREQNKLVEEWRSPCWNVERVYMEDQAGIERCSKIEKLV